MRFPSIVRLRAAFAITVTLAAVAFLITASAYATAAPPNDNQANATALDPDTSGATLTLFPQLTAGATKEVGEGDHAGDAGGASVWFSWAPDFNGTAYVSTAGSDFDTLLDITGASFPSSNDDSTDTEKTSFACFNATTRPTVKIAVDGYVGETGNLSLHYGAWNSSMPPCPESPPTLSGSVASPKVGNTITGTGGQWVGSNTGTYQWYRCHEYGCQTITGAGGPENASTQNYTVQARDIGEALFYEESGTGPGGTTTNSSVRSGVVGQATSPGINGRIFWASNRSDLARYHLYSMYADGSHFLQLTNDSFGENVEPAVSWDGRTLAYNKGGSLTVANTDGSAPFDLNIAGAFPSFVPDQPGTRLAFVGDGTGLRITNGSFNDAATALVTGTYRNVAWSPDGTKIAFSVLPLNSNFRIAVIQADGRGPITFLTSPTGTDADYSPAWSPDGTKIAFVRGSFSVSAPLTGGSLYVMNADGSGQTPFLTSNSSSTLVNSVSWSPDQQSFVYSQGTTTNNQLYKIPAGIPGGTPVQLTNSAEMNEEPYWAPQTTFDLEVDYTGNGTISGSSFIPCSAGVCDNQFIDGTTVTLTATPNPGYTFAGWDLAGCSGTGQCVVNVASNRLVNATFTPISDGVGGGGGGGGGGTSVPDLSVQWTTSRTQAATNDLVDLTAALTNRGGAGALQTHLFITIPAGASLVGPPTFDRGSGCTGTTTLDCNIDYVPNGGTTYIRFEIRITGSSSVTVSANATADRDSNPANNAASITIQVGTPTTTTTAPSPPTPPRTPASPTVGVTKNGNTGPNTLAGTARNDKLNGLGGNDTLNGFGGNDTLNGGLGNDRIFGGAGNDHLIGGPGKDMIHGDAGNDVIDARDGQKDTIDCGAGHDTVNADRLDVISHCEKVNRH